MRGLFVAVLAAAVLVPALARCPSGWTFSDTAGERCYKYVGSTTSWNGAEAGCTSLGSYSHLVSIHSNAENVLVYGFCEARRCHIGLNDIANEGTFVWSDGTPVDYAQWHGGEPNNCCGSEDCGEMWDRGGSTPTWNDMPCDGRFGDFAYVCSQPAQCPAGKYGTNVKTGCTNCPIGKYRASAGAVTSSDCTSCPSGRFGSSTGLTSSTCSGACAQGHYCLDGSTTSTATDCPKGTYGSSTGLGSSACNGVCAAGYYCLLSETSSEPQGQLCVAGRYGSFGQVNNLCTGPCSAGYYCTAGSGSSTQNQCGSANRYCPEGSDTFTTVTAGYYSTGGANANTRTQQEICEEGYYCSAGVRTVCPAGKYADTTGNSQCTQNCEAGYYCPAGSRTGTQDVCGTGANPANFYCPAGNPTRVTVSAGHYSTPESNPANQRSGQAACTNDYLCSNGVRTPKLEWNTNCAGTNAAAVSATENFAGTQSVSSFAATSNEGLGVSYTISNQAPNRCLTPDPLSIDASGALSLTSEVDLEECPEFTFTITATATGSVSLSCAVTLTVLDANDQPTIEANPHREVYEKSKINTAVGVPVFASDPDSGQELTFTISGGDSDNFKIGACSGQIAVLNTSLQYVPNNNLMTFTVTVTDDSPPDVNQSPTALSASTTVTVEILNINDPPVFTGNPSFSVYENAAAGQGLVGPDLGPTAYDEDGDTLTWSITRNDGNAFAIDPSTGAITVKNANTINFENRDAYNIQITVTDQALSVSKDFDITVIDVNDKPVLLASYSFSIAEDAGANTFVGAVTATDQDVGTTVTYSVEPADIFRIVDSPPMTGNIQLKHANLNFEAATSYTLVVTATDDGIGGDGGNLQATNTTVTVTVTNVNEVPYIWPQTVYVDEHTSLGTSITPRINATDPDNINLQTQLLFFTVNDTSRVSIGTLNGLLVVNKDFNYETPPASFAVLVTVTDNGAPVALSDSAVVTVIVNPINERPTFNTGVTRSVDELVPIGTAVGASLMSEASDPDAGTTLTFTMATDISGAFAVSSAGQLTTVKEIDYEQAAIYSIQVSISDGELSTLGQVTININNVNERPYVPVTKFSVPENEPAGTSVGQIEATDVDAGDQESLVYTLVTPDSLYRITTSGRVELKTVAPAFGAAATNLTVRATDSGGLFGDGWCEVSITNVNFRPQVPDHHVYVRENGDAYQVILWQLGATDVDAEQTLQYSIIGGFPEQDLGAFFVYATNGTVRLNGLSLNYETRNFYQLLIEVEDNGPGSLKAYSTVNVSLVNEPEYPYVAATRFSIAEDAAVNAVVGTVVASDEDVGNTLSFSISAQDGTPVAELPFAIGASTGTVTVTGALNFEAKPKYLLDVTVTDSDTLSSTANLTISVTNVNEAPTITAEDWSISESEPAGAPVGTVVASDVDAGTTLTYAITAGNVGNAFQMAQDGVLSLARKLDYENITSYTLTIQVTDNGAGALAADASFTITVLDAYDITFTEFTGATTMTTAGDEKVYIHGSNFGPTAFALSSGHSAATVSATYVSSTTAALTYTATCEVYTPNTVIECTTVAGVGANLQWTVTVNYESTSHTIAITTATTSYEVPAITGVAGADSFSTQGKDVFTLTGTNLGPVGTPIVVKYVAPAYPTVIYTGAQCAVTVADTTATCESVVGVGSALTFTVTIGAQTSAGYSGAGLFKYTNPAITQISGKTYMQTAGGQEVLLTGTNFGSGVTVTATYGDTGVEYAAAGCVISVAHTRIKCLSVPGVGAGLAWVVQVGGLYSALSTQTTSYKPPRITAVDGQGAVLADTAGGELVTLTGSNFGPAGGLAAKGAVPVVKYGGMDATRYTATKCNVSAEVPHTVINCFTAPGTGKDHAWKVEIDEQWSPVYLANTSYHPPIVASFPKGNPGASDANTEGDQGVVIQGDYFGSIALGTVPNVTYGPEGYQFAAQGCYILSAHTEIYCNTTEGAGADLKWVVQVDGQDSKAPTTNYGRPQVTSISGQPAGGFSTDGSETFSINGKNFGPRYGGFLDYVKYGPGGTEYTAVDCHVQSHFLITCQTVAGIGTANIFTVSISSQVSDASSAVMAYALPAITSISPDNAVTNGGTMITLDGTNFGLNDVFTKSNIKVEFEGDELLSEFPVTKSKSVHQVQFSVPMGYGVGKQVRLVLHGPNVDVYSNYVLFNYSVPVIDSFTPDPTNENIDGLPEFIVTVNGTSFCDNTECGSLYLGGTKLSPTNWTHNYIIFRSTLANDNLQVRVGFSPERSSNEVYYENVIPQISALSGSTINNNRYNTAGGQVLRFTGTQFHLTGMNVTVRGKPCNFLNGYPKEKTTAAGQPQEYELLCYTPQGQGVLNPVVVHLGQQSTVAYDEGDSMNVRYLAPTINEGVLERTGQIVSTVGADGTTVTIHMPTIGGHLLLVGEQFGQWYTETVNFFYRDSQPPVSAPRNHSAMNITLPEGDGTGYRLQLIVEEQDTTNMVYVDYDPPQIRSVAPLNGPTAGDINVTITGINFGVTMPTVVVGTENCPVISTDHFVIVCTLPANQGLDHEVVVTVNGQASVQAEKFLFDYDPPVLTSMTPTAGITNGGPVITLTGTNLGRRDAIVRFAVGSDGSAGWTAQGGNITSQTDNEIQFTLLEGQGIGHAVSVSISGQRSTYSGSTLLFTYNPPTISSISPLEAPTKGGTLLNIYGADFGVSDLSVTLGGRDCTNPIQEHNLVTCRIPQGLGENLQVLVTVLTRTSNAAIFNYSKPFVYTVVPNVPDANGAELEVVGVNFGWERTDVAIMIGEMECLNAVWRNDGSLECTMQRDVAGQKNVTITVAGQTVQLVGPFVPQCSLGYYGQVGELCIPCPMGGVCTGSFAEPYSDAGWWEVRIDTTSGDVVTGRRRLAEFSASCPVERAAGDVCSIMIPCEPKDSCLGNNTCSEGYTGERCADCTVGTHYRLAGECVQCPDNPELIVAFFLVAALGLCISGYVLNRKGVNLAFLSIGVDYFQVLALFATSKVDWPPALYALFQYLSAFNLNLEIAAPECSIPDVQYQTKWFSIMLLPVAACALFLILHTVKYVHKRWCKNVRKTQRNSHLSTMIGSLLVMFYYLYLYLTRTTLDVFNCGPTDPPDGKEYMEAVFEECYVAGLTQMTLLPFACVTLVVYTIGFPGFLFYTLRKNKDNIKTDQILRVLGEGHKRSSPTYQFRKRYHKMYYHFRPGKWYWILIIIGRKALLAVTALMFRSTAAFQLAMALLVMFVAYALQVRHTPYMNLHDKASIMKKFHEKVQSEKSALYAKIDTTIRTLMEDERRRHKRPQNWLQKRPSRDEVRQFFWDYNTVEAVLLFCAVLVNLAGIMFESGRFESSYYDGQRDLITYIVMFIVFASILYFIVVFCAEAFGVCTPGCMKKPKKLSREEKKQMQMEMTGRRQSIAVFQNNPMLTGANIEADDDQLAEFLGSDVLPPPGVWTTVRHKYQALADTVQELNQAVRDMKRQQEDAAGAGAGGGGHGGDDSRRAPRRGKRNNRTEFSSRPAARGNRKRGGKAKKGFATLEAGADEAV